MSNIDDIEAFINRHSHHIERICLRAAWGDENVCAELVNCAYLAIFNSWESRRTDADERQTKAWVKWQCRGAISHWRRSRHRHRWVPLDEEHNQLPASDDTAAGELIDELAAHLSESDRKLLDLMRQGYKYDEIAAIMGITTGNVKVKYSRMISQMRHIYEQITKQQQS